jgi:hypothetical protein
VLECCPIVNVLVLECRHIVDVLVLECRSIVNVLVLECRPIVNVRETLDNYNKFQSSLVELTQIYLNKVPNY